MNSTSENVPADFIALMRVSLSKVGFIVGALDNVGELEIVGDVDKVGSELG